MEVIEQSAYKKDDRFQKVAQFISTFKNNYFGSTAFQRYKNRCDITQKLVNQEKGAVELSTKFDFMLGLCRKHRDDFIETCMDIFDQDKWINCSSMKTGDDSYQIVNDIESFGNNVLADADYKSHWMERMSYLPVYGWSVSFSEFRWNSGWTVKPQATSAEASGIVWSRELDDSLSKPVCTAIHPYNWFGDVDLRINKQIRQGLIRRWTIRDVVYAMEKKAVKVDPNGGIVMQEMLDLEGNPVIDAGTGLPVMEPVEEPLYNQEALNKLLEALKNGSKSSDSNYYNESQRQKNDFGNENAVNSNAENSGRYADVLFYIGTLDEVEGFYGDPNIYVIECWQNEVLRIYENPIDCISPINHIQTHSHTTDCFTDTMLDATIPHDKISYLLINLGLENVFDDLHRVIVAHEDDYINFSDLISPQSLNTILYLSSPSNRQVPVKMDNQSGSLQSMQQIFNIVSIDRQRTGVTDQQLGVQVQGDKTATAARILASATNKATRAIIKRCCADGLLPEFRYILLLGMQYYTPEKLIALSKNGEVNAITPQIAQMIVNKNGFRVNDNFTRDKDTDAANLAEFITFANPIMQGLSTPNHAINMIRNMARIKGIDEVLDIDLILPAPQAEQSSTMPPQQSPLPANTEMTDQQVAQGVMNSETPQQAVESLGDESAIL